MAFPFLIHLFILTHIRKVNELCASIRFIPTHISVIYRDCLFLALFHFRGGGLIEKGLNKSFLSKREEYGRRFS